MANKLTLSRREFIRILTTAVSVYPLSGLAESRNISSYKLETSNNDSIKNSNKNHQIHQKKEPWLTITNVQQHLFPAETDSPGAQDIHALEYLQAMMDTPDFEEADRKLIKDGVGWLNDLAKQQYSRKFIEIETNSKEKILRKIESSSAGERWLSVLLTYLLEALLADPVYEGNPNGIGWRWLQHQPGFPRPPENKKYYKLGKIRYRNAQSRSRYIKA